MKVWIRATVIVCLWLAFLLRVWGLDFGLPYEFHPDEHQYVDVALNWYTTGQLEARFVNPPLFTYVLAAAFGPWLALTPFSPSAGWISSAYVFARLWSVGFGLLTVALVYPLGRRLFHWPAGLLALILMAGLFLPARESHFAVNDAAVTFFALLAIYFSLLILQRRRGAAYLAAGVAVGLATAAKFTGGLVGLALLAAHGLVVVHDTGSISTDMLALKKHRYLWLGLLATLATFLILSLHQLWHFPQFAETAAELVEFGARGLRGARMAPATGWQFYLYVLSWGAGWVMLLAMLAAIGGVLWRRRPEGILLAVFPLALFTYMGAQKALSARYLLPAIPPLVVLVAAGLAWLAGRWPFFRRHQSWFWPLLIAALLAQPLANLVWFDHLLTLADTRQIATEWFIDEFPEDTVVAKENYAILPETAFISKPWPYKIIYLDRLDPNRDDLDYYVSHKTQVIALSNFIFDRVRPDPAAEVARRQQLAYLDEKAALIKTFNPYRQANDDDWFYLDQLYGPAAETLQRVRPGPLIKIYRLPYESQPYSLDVPPLSNPVDANLGGKLKLLGYDLAARRAEPGGAFPLTLYWQALTRLDETYLVFNRLLDNQQRRWGGYDRWPQETANTILWQPGEVVVDTFNVPVAPDAPAGVYTIDLGLYDQADPSASPLPVLQADGRPTGQNSLRIGPVKVGGPPPEAVLSPDQATPQTQWSIQFGRPPAISSRGYDLTRQEDGLRLRLYWESLARTAVDWSVFVHVRNKAGQIIAQKDGPAGGGRYPTSLWDAGEIIADELMIPLPPETANGAYDIVIGLYDLRTGQRLIVPGHEANEVALDIKPD